MHASTDFLTRLTRARNLHASGAEWGRDVIRGARSRASVVAALAAYPADERCVLAFGYAQAVRDCVRMRGGEGCGEQTDHRGRSHVERNRARVARGVDSVRRTV